MKRHLIFGVGLTALLLWSPGFLRAGYPAWWGQRGATNTTAANDFAVANIGQMKNLASKAAVELNTRLAGHGGAGQAIDNLIASWLGAPAPGVVRNDFGALNQGQLKNVARLFYDRLADFGYMGPPLENRMVYPWSDATSDDANSALVNLGQLKAIFSFQPGIIPGDVDHDGLPDSWELTHFGGLARSAAHPTYGLPWADSDGDGLANILEYATGGHPLGGGH